MTARIDPAGAAMTRGTIRNAFTVDVEDYFHVSAFADRVDRRHWDGFESRVVDNTRRLLQVCARHGVRGTFFVLGWVAERHPELVREIARDGHEIGCHSYWHRLIYELTPDEFRADLRQSRDVLQQIVGHAVDAFRAPSFSIVRRSLWALDILADEGFRYDSSIFPVHHDRYGIPEAESFPFEIELGERKLREFPPAVWRLPGLNLPVGGGGYFRLYPFRMTQHALRRINIAHQRPFVVYVHPWEVDPHQPRLSASLGSRFRHYVNLAKTEARLDRLFGTFRFDTLSAVLAEDLDDSAGANRTVRSRVWQIDAAAASLTRVDGCSKA